MALLVVSVGGLAVLSDDYPDERDDEDCERCGGDGVADCPDWLLCGEDHGPDEQCSCRACGGSGAAVSAETRERREMTLTLRLTTTEKIVTINGIPARIWEGVHEETGVAVHAYITRIGIPADTPPEKAIAFDRALVETRAPSPEVAAIPARLVL